MADPWSPERYGRFRAERERPFEDLLALVEAAGLRAGGRVLDLGCGTGAPTRRLHECLAARATVGLDRSARMLAEAAPLAGGGLVFLRGDLAAPPLAAHARFDLVLSNAALQWVDDHPALLARLAARLAPRGLLAVQVPANHDHPSHAIAAELAGEEPFLGELGGWRRRSPVLAPEGYARVLHRLGLVDLVVRQEVYLHLLPEAAAVVEWTRGTLLTAYERRLAPASFARFVERYRERLLETLGGERPFPYPFPRTLLLGRRPRTDGAPTA